MTEEYTLTFLEAMKALCEGKDVMCELYPWVFCNRGGRIMYGTMGETHRKYWFDKADVVARWRVSE